MIKIAAILSAVCEHGAALAVIMLLLINAAVGFWQEYTADTAIAAHGQRLAFAARVTCDGAWRAICARLLAPVDLVKIGTANIVSAGSGLIARQGERSAVVTATGMRTDFGRAATLLEQTGAVSHFQRAVLRLGNFLILTTAARVGVSVIAGQFQHDALLETIPCVLMLAVASIPVALPAVPSVTRVANAVQGVTHGPLDQRMDSHVRHRRRVDSPLPAPVREIPRHSRPGPPALIWAAAGGDGCANGQIPRSDAVRVSGAAAEWRAHRPAVRRIRTGSGRLDQSHRDGRARRSR